MAPGDDSENLIHKLGRNVFLPAFIKLRKTFGRLILVVLILLYPILIALTMLLGYILLLLASCTFKTIHTILVGEWSLGMYNLPTELAQLHPTVVCSMSYISSVILFIFMGIFLGGLVYAAYYIHEYVKEHHIDSIM